MADMLSGFDRTRSHVVQGFRPAVSLRNLFVVHMSNNISVLNNRINACLLRVRLYFCV